MMINQIISEIQQKISSQIRLVSEGADRYRVFTPFMFEDGDHLAIVLKNVNNNWMFSDEGHTYMHLTYDVDERDLQKGTRQTIITNTLNVNGVTDSEGELSIIVRDERYGDYLYSFIQALIRISDISYLKRETVKSTFLDDFKSFLEGKVAKERITFQWFDKTLDPNGNYTIDCRINGMPKPLYIFAINADDRARDATITLYQFEKWGKDFQSIAIFENQEEINRKVLARLSDVFEKQYSSLEANKDRIAGYLQTIVQ